MSVFCKHSVLTVSTELSTGVVQTDTVLIVDSPSIVVINNSYQNHTKYIITTFTKGTYGMYVHRSVYGAHVLRLLNLHTLDYFHIPTDTVKYCTKFPFCILLLYHSQMYL